MTDANSRQVGGNHYSRNAGAVQHWDIVAQHELDYFQGQITKYVMRWQDKGGIQDLEKARHFLDKYIELERAKLAPASQLMPELAARGYGTTGQVGQQPAKGWWPALLRAWGRYRAG